MKYGSVSKLKFFTNTSINKSAINRKTQSEKKKTQIDVDNSSLVLSNTKFKKK